MYRIRRNTHVTASLAALGIIAGAGCGDRGPSPAAPPPSTAGAPANEAVAKSALSVPGPVEGTRISEAYARMVARDTYFWAWPMVNVYNRRLTFAKLPEPGLIGGLVPAAPPNQLAMLSDYVEPLERAVACPNQDVVYGFGLLALDVEPVVIQVP